MASTGYAQVVSNNLRCAYINGRASMDFSIRLELLKAITLAGNDLASIPRTTIALKKAMAKFDETDATLVSRLSGNPSAADRKKAAELSRQQILADAMTLPGNASAPTTDDYPYGRFRVLQCKGYTDSSEQPLPEL